MSSHSTLSTPLRHNYSTMASTDCCVLCTIKVGPRQEGLQCDTCKGWCHRKCQTTISRAEYRMLVREQAQFSWLCPVCIERTAETPTLEEELMAEVNLRDDEQPEEMDITPAEPEEMDITPAEPEEMDITPAEPEEMNIEEEPSHFNISLPLGPVPEPVEEESLPPPPVPTVLLDDQPVTYSILKGASKRGGDLVTDSNGYLYTKKRASKTTTNWMCASHTRHKCYAIVIQRDTAFSRGKGQHNHPADPAAAVKNKVRTLVCNIIICIISYHIILLCFIIK